MDETRAGLFLTRERPKYVFCPKNIKNNSKVSFCVDTGINSPYIFGVMGQGNAKLIRGKNEVSKIEKRILLRYFKTLSNKSAKELLDETDCVIEIRPKKYSVWEY